MRIRFAALLLYSCVSSGLFAQQPAKESKAPVNSKPIPSATKTTDTPTGPRMAPSPPLGPAAASPRTPVTKLPPAHGTAAPFTAPPAPGMVWVNRQSKVYHKEGSRWFGRTKAGVYMTEADARKKGYRASKDK